MNASLRSEIERQVTRDISSQPDYVASVPSNSAEL